MELDDNKIEKMMQASVNMRDKIDELENQITEIKTQKDKVGTLSRTLRTRYWTSDWPEMYKFIKENDMPEFFEKRLVQSTVKEFLEQNPDKAPPGLQATSEYTVRITKSRTKEEV
jgi:hypothetical protein